LNQEYNQDVEKKTEKTKKYDAVGDKVRKLLGATGATYIPDLCDALAEDWYPHLRHDMINRFEEPVNEIRNKVLNDWSKERNENGEWKTRSIEDWFPKWLKNQEYIERFKDRKSPSKDSEKFRNEAQGQKNTLDNVANALPPVPEEEQDIGQQKKTSYSGTGRSWEPTQKEKATPEELYTEVVKGLERAWIAMTDKDHLPGVKEDVLLDYIKPSDKHRLRMLKGLGYGEAVNCINILTWTDMCIQRTLRMWKDISKDMQKKNAIER